MSWKNVSFFCSVIFFSIGCANKSVTREAASAKEIRECSQQNLLDFKFLVSNYKENKFKIENIYKLVNSEGKTIGSFAWKNNVLESPAIMIHICLPPYGTSSSYYREYKKDMKNLLQPETLPLNYETYLKATPDDDYGYLTKNIMITMKNVGATNDINSIFQLKIYDNSGDIVGTSFVVFKNLGLKK